ncbi:DUF6907 domain-containing protein [Parafrankia sp. FMc2]|uniref:DUF6907 domain-containing protein n=1 Tax=Parafrankia sp. FMc2 TaxID=3233196 RepID=UPI0034D66042
MTRDADRSCPPWCKYASGHLHLEPEGPGDYHYSEFTVLPLPQLPGLRERTEIQTAIEQHITATTTHQPMIWLGLGPEGRASEALTLDEATALAAALTRAVARVHNAPGGPGLERHDPV